MAQRKRLGEILVEAHVISAEQVEQALHLQQENHKLLGQILVEMGWATEQEVCKAVAKVLDIGYVRVDYVLLSQEVIELIPAELALQQHILPLFIQDRTLYVAMENALDADLVHHLEAQTGLTVQSLIAPPIQLQEAIRRHYEIDRYVGSLLDRIDSPEPEEIGWEFEDRPDQSTVDSDRIKDINENALERLLDLMIAEGLSKRASAIHLEPTMGRLLLRYKIDGLLTSGVAAPRWLQTPLLTILKEIAEIKTDSGQICQSGRFTGAYAGRQVDLLAAAKPTAEGEKLIIRMRDPKTTPPHLNRLGFSLAQQRTCRSLAHQPNGWILVTGPPSCGKTTTLYALLNAIKDGAKHIVTLEQPVESRLVGVHQFQLSPGAPPDFASALRSVLPKNPDVILLGEIRDAETAPLAMRAAHDHLILSPLHAENAVAAIYRLCHLGVPAEQIAEHLLLVIAQRLVRRICPQCKTRYMPDPQELQGIGLHNGHGSALTCYHGAGCPTCEYTGYYGQTTIGELLAPTATLQAEIRHCPSSARLQELARETGLETMLQDGLNKIQQGITTIEEVTRVYSMEHYDIEHRMTCPNCGETMPETADRCPTCQYRMTSTCTRCGALLEPNWPVCPFCGVQTWPTSQPQHPARPSVSPETPRDETRIVVAEDDERTRDTVASLLEQQGYQVSTASNGADALQQIRLQRPALIILDMEISKRNHFSLSRTLHASIETMFTPIVVLTEHDSLEDKLQGLSLGIDDFITKPIEADNLLNRVEFALQQGMGRPLGG